jgi:prepilin-type N-terminal cleavage/methylation domain-containing protein
VAEPAPARRGERGFTLVEVLVAMAVLGIVLGTVYRIYGSGMLAVTRNADELRLALVADALLERALLDLDPRRGELRGELAGGLEWRLSAAPLELPRARSRAGRARRGVGRAAATVGAAGRRRRRPRRELRPPHPASRRGAMSAGRERGFTLVEFLVALAILGLVMAIVGETMRYAWGARARMLERSDGTQSLVLARDLVRRELERAQRLPWREGGRQRLAFEGDARRLRFVNATPVWRAGPAWQLWELAIAQEPEGPRQLLLRRAPIARDRPGFAPLAEAPPRLLARADGPLAFAYLAPGRDGEPPRWLDSWTEPDGMPLAVGLSARGDPGWPDLLVRLLVDAGPACAGEAPVAAAGCQP